MSKTAFRDQREELERLVQEIESIKSTIKEVGATVSRIERHVRRAFDVPKPSKEKRHGKKCYEPTKTQLATPAISPNEALKVFDELSVLFAEGQGAGIEARLQKMTTPDLQLLARELGVPLRSRPSKKSLCSRIVGRLNERAMLSKNVNITQPQTQN